MSDLKHYKDYIQETQANSNLAYREPMTVEHVESKIKRLKSYASDTRNPKAEMYQGKIEQLETVLVILRGE